MLCVRLFDVSKGAHNDIKPSFQISHRLIEDYCPRLHRFYQFIWRNKDPISTVDFHSRWLKFVPWVNRTASSHMQAHARWCTHNQEQQSTKSCSRCFRIEFVHSQIYSCQWHREPVVTRSHAGILHKQWLCTPPPPPSPPPFTACQTNAWTNPLNEPSYCFKTNLLVKSINHELEHHKATLFLFHQ